MFCDDDRPEWDPLYADEAREFVKLSPNRGVNCANYAFYLGDLLAHMHISGHGYSDMHAGNVGLLPSGGLIILDAGGTTKRRTTPHMCAGDFVVPALEFGPRGFAAFWQGYLLAASKFIDPLIPNFCSDLRHILFGFEPYDPLPSHHIAESVEAALDGRFDGKSHGPTETVDTVIIALAIASLNFGYDTAPDLHHFLRVIDVENRLGSAGDIIELGDAIRQLGTSNLIASIPYLSLRRPLSSRSGTLMRCPIGRPRSALLTQFVGAIIDEEPVAEYARQCVLNAVHALVLLSRTRSNDPGTALAYGCVAFSVAASPNATLDELERYNLLCWRLWASIGGYTNVGPSKVVITDPNTGLELALLNHKAACSDRNYFVSSLERARTGGGYEPVWPAALSAIDANRKSLLLIFYTLSMLPFEERVPEILSGTLLTVLKHRIWNEIQTLALASQVDRTGILSVLGNNPDLIIKGSEWAKRTLELLETGHYNVGDCFGLLKEGREYFSYVNLEVDILGKTIKHCRMDIFYGIGQALDEERLRLANGRPSHE